MSRMSVNPNFIYGKNEPLRKSVLKEESLKAQGDDFQKAEKQTLTEKKIYQKPSTTLELSDKSKELKESLSGAEKALRIHNKKFGNIEKPGIYFVSGFDWFGAGSIKGNYDGINDMAEAIEGASHFSWDEQDAIIADIKKRKPDEHIILVGHSFGGDGIVEIADRLNTVENGFRKIDLLVTLDSVGADNDFIPQNVKKNLNFIAQGPYNFLNDTPNIALNYKQTKVENYLRHEKHAQLDDSIEIQMQILEEVGRVLKGGLGKA